MTLSEIRRILDEMGTRPVRKFGQNFLYDQNVAQKIASLLEAPPGIPIIEIGPGLGSLTDWLAPHHPELLLLEKDKKFIPHLSQRYPQATIVEGDAMETLPTFTERIHKGMVVGNLPYSVASAIMVLLCEESFRPLRMVFTIQLEVAERLVAKEGTKDYGLLTLLTRPFYQIQIARKLPPHVFWPEPDVDSATVIFDRLPISPFNSIAIEKTYRTMVKKAFQKRRKTLGSIFGKGIFTKDLASRRPEEIQIPEWIEAADRTTAPQEEIFDVVNESDEVTGQQPRSLVHRKGLLHRAVHILVWNPDGKVLLQKRSATKDVSPNTWDSSAAGHLGSGEGYDEAASREILEELGISPPLQRLDYFQACVELGWEFVHLYQTFHSGPFVYPESEIAEVQWWTPEDIDKAIHHSPTDFAGSFRYIWKHHRCTPPPSDHAIH